MSVSDAAILKISDEKTLELVELYKKEECLWDTSLPDYRIKHKRRKAAERIARILDIPNFGAKHVMTKFKNLRNSYCQELKKIAICQNLSLDDDAAQSRKTKPKQQWYAVMDSFIRPHLQINCRSYSGPTLVINGGIIKREPEPEPIEDPDELWDNQDTEEVSSEYSRTHDVPVEEADDDDPDGVEEAIDEAEVINEVFENESNKRPASTCTNIPPKRMRSEDLLAESLKEVSTQLTVLKDDIATTKEQKSQKQEDYHDNFGKYIASLLRLLPTHKALSLQPKIVNMVAKEVIEDQEDNLE